MVSILFFLAGFIAGFFIAGLLLLLSLNAGTKDRPLTKEEWKSGMREKGID